MADNTLLNPGTGGDTIATDDIGGGVKVQRVKVGFGADGAFSDVTPTNPMPVAQSQAEYETVAASQTDQVLGATGGIGDYLGGLLITPATTSPGAVSIKDGAGTSIVIFTGGATSVSNLVPFFVPLGIKATGAGWKVTTGANVSAIGVGDFT